MMVMVDDDHRGSGGGGGGHKRMFDKERRERWREVFTSLITRKWERGRGSDSGERRLCDPS